MYIICNILYIIYYIVNVHTNSHMLQLTRRVIGIQQTPNTSYIIHTFNLSHRINNVVFCYKYKKHISVDPKISTHCKKIFGNYICTIV